MNYVLQDVPVPAFMQTKSEDEWSEEEKKAVQEYERKVKELNEEREKYRKVCCHVAKIHTWN